MEAWSGSGSSVLFLLDKQAPGPGGVVDVCGSGYAPALFLIFFCAHTNTPTHPHTHTHTSTHTDTHFPRREVFACTETQILDEQWTPTKHKQTQRRAGAQGSLGAGGVDVANGGRVEITERACGCCRRVCLWLWFDAVPRSEEHTSELQSRE